IRLARVAWIRGPRRAELMATSYRAAKAWHTAPPHQAANAWYQTLAAKTYLGASAGSPAFFRLSQLYLRWNFSTRPVVSTYFILPVKKGWQAEQISTVMFLRVLRVTNLLPQPQVTVASTYFGWIPDFMACLVFFIGAFIIGGFSVGRQG